jgi:hypothetical protein
VESGVLILNTALKLFSFYYQKPVTIEFEVAKVVAVMVYIAFFVLVDMGEELEIKAQARQPFSRGFGKDFPAGNDCFENVAVLFKGMVDIPDEVYVFSVLLIVVGISTAIVTKFLVYPALNRLSAMKAISFFLSHR